MPVKQLFTRFLLLLGVLACLGRPTAADERCGLFYQSGVPQTEFAAAEIRAALKDNGDTCTIGPIADLPQSRQAMRIAIAATAAESKQLAAILGVTPVKTPMAEQSYSIRRKTAGPQTTCAVLSADPAGAMYGGLDLAEAIRLGTLADLKDSDHAPFIARRGIKFNISLDRRTPTYSDNSDSAQANIPEVWSKDFWHTYFDEMARRRFNVLSLWSLHPFPSIVKVPEYPDVALDDVWGTKGPIDAAFNMNGPEMARPFALPRVEVVKKMTIGQKIKFWQEVMQYAKDRGVDIYWFTWNIFVWGTEGKYGLTEDGKNPATIAYFRASVRETVRTYPLLAGIGITAGENMKSREGRFDHERWLWETYGEGIRDALAGQPGRRFRLIHRYHQTAQNEVLRAFKQYPGPLDFSFKYSVAHMYSETNPPFIGPVLKQMPASMRTWLTVRNDDIYSFRWGDPEFARGYIRNMPGPDRLAGFYMGPDGYCWGREFIDRQSHSPRPLVLQRQWYSFMLWGRLSYEPDLPDDLFRRTLAARFPQVPADKLFEAMAEASRIIPQVTRFFWRDLDFQWFPEACTYRDPPKGFYSVKAFAEGVTMPGSGLLNIRQWRSRRASGAAMEGPAPPQVAEALKAHAGKTLALVAELRPRQDGDRELRLTLGDCEAMAHLGNYYAEKILAAADLALFDSSGRPEQQASAIAHLQSALDHWKQYAAVATRQYVPQHLGRIGYVDLVALTANVQDDIAIAKHWRQGTIKGDGEAPVKGDVNFRP